MARASCALQSTSRWAITGTPIQNRSTDLASLLEFLKVYPFSDPKIFDRELIKPWLKSRDRDVSRLKKLINCMSLCRTKDIIDLPRREDEVHFLDFSPDEKVFYDLARQRTIGKMNDALSSKPLQPGQYLHALRWLNELRLICNHGLAHSKRDSSKARIVEVQPTEVWDKVTANKAFETIICANQATCAVCDNVLTDGTGEASRSEFPKAFLSKCLTLICGSCVKDFPNKQKIPTCLHNPQCQEIAPAIEVSWAPEKVTNTGLGRELPITTPEQVSTKLKTLLKSLQECPSGEKRYHPTQSTYKQANRSHSVVFSYWTFTLDLIESLLKQYSISYTRIDGQHSGEKREEAIQKFQTDETVQVILVSITCGGAGYALFRYLYA